MIVAGLVTCISHVAWAQYPYQEPVGVTPRSLEKKFQNWAHGYVVLVTGDTVRCEMNYNGSVSEGLLQVRDDGNTLTLSVKEVKAFSYFDEKENLTRRFYTLPIYAENTSTLREYFLEYVYENPHIAILRHHTVTLKTYNSNPTYPASFKDVVPYQQNYLLNVQTGKLFALNKKEAMTLMETKKNEIEAYLRSNSIKLKRKVEDYIKVLDYYATL